jgi:hypothetical protein
MSDSEYKLSVPQMIARRRAAKAARNASGRRSGGVNFDIQVTGLREAILELEALKGHTQRALGLAVRRGGKIVLQSARQVAIKDTKALSNSLAARTRTYGSRKKDVLRPAINIVGPRVGYVATVQRRKVLVSKSGRVRIFYEAQTAMPNNYDHIIARGARPHSLLPKARLGRNEQQDRMHPGVRKRNFMEMAAEISRSRVASEMSRTIAQAIQKRKAAMVEPLPTDVLDK